MTFTGFSPHTKQKQIIEEITTSDAKFHIASIGRQFGKSLMGMNLALYWAINHRPCKILWVSPVYSQASKVHKELYSAIAESGIVKNNNFSNNEIELHTGSTIIFRSAERYDNIRGLTCDYGIVDEAAFMKDDAWQEAIRPVFAVRGKKVLFISTPKGKNWFYDLFQLGNSPDNKNYKAYTGSSFDTPYMPVEELQDAKKTLPEPIFKQEYLAEFLDSGGEVFSNIDECIVHNPKHQGPYVMGVDFGKQEDYTVATVMSSDGIIVDWYRNNKTDWTQMIKDVADLAIKYNATTLVEVNGIGDPLFDQLQKLHYNTQPFVTSNKSKQEIIEGLILDFNEKNIGLPPRSAYEALHSELEVFTYDYNPKTRSIRYGHPSGLNDDTVLSLAIANYNRKQNQAGRYAVMGRYR